jgi:hypothetical protein
VSSALPSLLSSNQINVALELHHSLTNTTHPFLSPIAPGSLTGDFPVAGTRHLAVDRPPQASTGQIDPAFVIPYLCSCLTTTPSAQNRVTDEEPSRNFTGDRFSTPLTPSPPLLAGTWARTHGSVPTPSPAGGPARPPAPALSWAKNPPAQLAGNSFSFFLFPFPFSYFHVFMHILIFYAPKIV